MWHNVLWLALAAALATNTGCSDIEMNGPSEDQTIDPPATSPSPPEEITTFGTVTTIFALPPRQDDWPAGDLAGVGFQPDEGPDNGAIAPGKPLFFTNDVSAEHRSRLSAILQPGHRAWITATDVGGIYAASQIEVLPFNKATEISDHARTTTASINFIELGAWHNRMPPSTDKRHLVVSLRITNDAKTDCPVRIRRAFYSFDAGIEGVLTDKPLTFIDPGDGMPGAEMEESVKADSTADLTLRAIDAYPSGHADEQIYLIVILDVGGERVVLRRDCKILVAY